ncbi:MAG: Eco57I restriction-modification methylase domain-containing protein, partial [bacterium]
MEEKAKSIPRHEAANYRITDADDLGSGGPKAKYADNVRAIRLLKELASEQRQATLEEQKILVRYVGWGGLSQAFDSKNEKWSKEYEELKELLSETEYRAARRSTQNAHYTSFQVIQFMHQILERLGFRQGRALEPSVGVGHFIGMLPPALQKTTVFGVELDEITGAIAQQLYPKANIQAGKGFQEVNVPAGYFDLVFGNPPFGNEKVFDPAHPDLSKFSIHNYFFAKSIEALRPGGLLTMVVSNSLMDKQGQAERQWMSERTRFIGAIRLPNNAFKQNAGTEVTTDILILQKLSPEEQSSPSLNRGPSWLDLKRVTDPKTGQPIPTNEYFATHPEMMLGTMTLSGSMYRAGTPALVQDDSMDLQAQLERVLQELPEGLYTQGKSLEESTLDASVQVPKEVKVGGYFVDPQGQIRMRKPDQLGSATSAITGHTGTVAERIKSMVKVRDALKNVLRAELQDAPQRQLQMLRDALNKLYDQHVQKHGLLHEEGNRRAMK